jgi:hypothetical protein
VFDVDRRVRVNVKAEIRDDLQRLGQRLVVQAAV